MRRTPKGVSDRVWERRTTYRASGGEPAVRAEKWASDKVKTRREISRGGAASAIVLTAFFLVAALAAAGDIAVDSLLSRHDAAEAEIFSSLYETDLRYGSAPLERRDDYYSRLLSQKKNAFVTVGGDIRATYSVTRSNFVDKALADPMAQTAALGKASIYDFGMSRARLSFDMEMGQRWRAFIELNLEENSRPNGVSAIVNPNRPGLARTAEYPSEHRGDILGEAYVELRKASHSGFGMKIGRMEMPFGVAAKPELFAESYLAAPDLTGSYLMTPLNRSDSPLLPHASAPMDPVMGVMASYEMRDIVRFQAAFFQERDKNRDILDGHNRYVSRDPAYRSFQLGVSLLPLEDWELTVAFRNRYDKGRGVDTWANSPYRGDFRDNLAVAGRDPRWANGQWSADGAGTGFGSRANEQALMAGLALEIPNTNLSFFAEYAHGWNQGFNRYIHSDDVNVGVGYRLTPRLTLFGQYEWLSVKDRSWLVGDGAGGWLRDVRSNRLNRYLLALEYELMAGLTLEAGWQYENWHFRSSYGGPGAAPIRKTLTANMFYVGTRFIF